MLDRIKMSFLKNKALAIAGAAVLFFFLAGIKAYNSYSLVKRTAQAKKAEAARFAGLETRYASQKSLTDKKLRKAYSQDMPIVSIIEEISKRTGVSERMKSVKPLEERETSGYIEREASVRFEGLSLNELVNLLYKIEEHGSLLLVKDFSMKSRFSDPQSIDASMTITHITKAQKLS